MTALIAVLKWKSCSRSSVTRRIVSWIVRRKARAGSVVWAGTVVALAGWGGAGGGAPPPPPDLIQVSEDEAPDAVQEAARALDAVLVPVEILLGRRREEREEARGVGAERPDQVVGIDHVALGLRHLGAVLDDHALREERGERLVHLHE